MVLGLMSGAVTPRCVAGSAFASTDGGADSDFGEFAEDSQVVMPEPSENAWAYVRKRKERERET